MNNKLEMEFSNGMKSVRFSMEGYSEDVSKEIVRNILIAVTKSGNVSKIENEESPIYNVEDVVEKPKDLDTMTLKTETAEEDKPTCKAPEEADHIHPYGEIEDAEAQTTVFGFDNETYQTYYICKCGDKGKHRIKRSQIYINCWKCGQRMRVRDAHPDGFPMKDMYGNVFIAGEYKRTDHQKYGAMVY